ncbi:MAG TPA: L,D-transpeptidase family protein [Gaiellaceae bacterium]
MASVAPPRRKRLRRGLWVALGLVLVLVAAAVTAVVLFSGAKLDGDPSALARVALQPFAGSVESVTASDADGPIALVRHNGRLVPRRKVTPGETVSITVVVRRPGWLGWALGHRRTERLTVKTPVATVRSPWITVQSGDRPRVRFDAPVSEVVFGSTRLHPDGAIAVVPTSLRAGSVRLAAAARPWESLGTPVRVTWFPQANRPVVLAQPAPGAKITPLTPLRLTFSRPVSDVLGGEDPTVSSDVRGSWTNVDSHTLVFRPGGRFGMPFASDVHAKLSSTVALVSADRRSVKTADRVSWSVAPASFLRLQQLLAQEGYLPVTWVPTDDAPPTGARAQLTAAVSPPAGHFDWTYPDTPSELKGLWQVGEPNEVVRGAVMMFEHDHGLTVDGLVGPQVWHAVLADALAGKHRTDGYSYVYVHRNVPQLLTLWHNGSIVLTSPGNTGVPAAPTALGTWPVFEHIPVGTMAGTNPDGSHYNDPGIRWISYFHGGEALHAFNRASFGTPQSLGCVELPLDAAAQVWPYTPIGTLVTIEN